MNPLSIGDEINFKTLELRKGEIYKIGSTQIITVVEGQVRDRVKGILNTFESSVYYGGEIEATNNTLITIFDIKNKDIILNKIDVNGNFGEYCRKNWTQLRGLYDIEGFEKIDLYRGNQIDYSFNGVKYKFNLWFCGKEVDCLWHNQHSFIETHTNIAGDGYMQKSLDGTDNGLIETVGLLPGNSHKKFNIDGENEENGNPKYPFHRWLGGSSGNIWLVIEKY
ncbi:hypothetical protein HUU51_04045 [Candidatus Gracilibacteria bacterium]|nr:hypothetical protein [Candidatus Gracilibacteria bacterium]